MKKYIYFALFSIYIAVVLRLTVFRDTTYDQYKVNLRLFCDLAEVYKNAGLWQFVRLFFGNILWFVPFGFFLRVLLKNKSLMLTTLCGFGFSLCVETSQLVFKKGFFEIDDLILNTLGAVIGYGICKFISLTPLQRRFDIV